MPTSKRIKYRNKCQPLEKVTAGSRWYLDSDIGKTLTGTDTISGLLQLDYDTKTASHSFGTTFDFIYIKCTGLTSGTVTVSFDDTDNGVIKLLESEGFSSRIDTDAEPRVIISGEASIEYITGK